MRKLLYAFIIGSVITLGGCQSLGLGPVHRDTAVVIKEDPAKAVRYAVDELNAGIAALATALVHDYQEGLYTQDEIKGYFDKLNQAVMYANQAENFSDLGNILKANERLGAAQAIIGLLQAELVKHKGNK